MTTLSFLICPNHTDAGKQIQCSQSLISQPLNNTGLISLDTQSFIQARHAKMLDGYSNSSYSPRWKTVSVHLSSAEFDLMGLVRAFNQNPEASILTVVWNNKVAAQYRCTNEYCMLTNFERLADNFPITTEQAEANFLDRSVEDGTKQLWSTLYLAGIDPSLVPSFESIENGTQHMPLKDTIQIYTDTQTRVIYLDWSLAVIKNFNALVQFSQQSDR